MMAYIAYAAAFAVANPSSACDVIGLMHALQLLIHSTLVVVKILTLAFYFTSVSNE